jgi:hypothetical protein
MKEAEIMSSLASFFLLFEAQIENYEIIDDKIVGTLSWKNEDDKQDFSFFIKSDFDFNLFKALCCYLNEAGLVDGDRIKIAPEDLKIKLIRLGWMDSNAKKAIDELCSFEVKMLDDGEETDSFFIHF